MAGTPNNTPPNNTNTRTQNDAPLGDLDVSQYTYSNFIYPLDLGTAGAGNDHYMVFHINETSTTQFNTRTVGGNAPNPNTPQGQATINRNNAPAGPQGNTASPPQQTNNSQPIARVATTIVLYMPQDITCEYHAEWEQVELGSAAAMTEKLFGDGSWVDVFKSLGA